MVRKLLQPWVPVGEVVRDPRLRVAGVVVLAKSLQADHWSSLSRRDVCAMMSPPRENRRGGPDETGVHHLHLGHTVPKGVMHSHIIVRNVVDRAFRNGLTPAIPSSCICATNCSASPRNVMSDGYGARQISRRCSTPNESLCCSSRSGRDLHGFDTHYKDLLEALPGRPCDTSSVDRHPASGSSSCPWL